MLSGRFGSLALLWGCLSFSASAQEAPPMMRVAFVKVSMTGVYEWQEAMKLVNEGYRKAGVPWRSVWQSAMFGEMGNYVTVTPVKNMAQFDQGSPMMKLTEAERTKYLTLIRNSVEETRYVLSHYLTGLSLDSGRKTPPVFARVTTVKTRAGKGPHFEELLKDSMLPALKRADIGVAMGVTGTDVSKEAAHMILLDDNFATIVKAVREGRRIFDNIRKFIKYTMTSNSGEIWTIFLAPFFGLPIPLLPIHILWINLVTDGLPGLALAVEPVEKGAMQRPPRHPKESIFAHGLGIHIIWVGLLMGFVSIFAQAWSIQTGIANWQTMVFTVLCLSQMGHVLAIRSETESLFSQGFFTNKPLVGAFLVTFVLQMATIYVPFLNPIFKTAPLTLFELGFSLGLSVVVFVAVEIEKLFKRRRLRLGRDVEETL